MTRENIIRLEGMLGRAYELSVQVLNGDEPDTTLAEEISGECAELLALINGDMGAFGEPELIDPELLSLNLFLKRESA
jgi:hypothetical protein